MRALGRIGTVVLVVLGVGAGATFGVDAIVSRWRFEGLRPVPRSAPHELSPTATTFASADKAHGPATVAPVADTQASAVAMPDSTVAVEDSGAAAPPPAPAPPAIGLEPMIAEGRTELGDSVYAVREGETVTVHFDTFLTRTRRRDKFDRIVRATLPRIYGAPADSLLATVPDGQIAQGGDLVAELPNAGISFELADGSTLALWPRTRPGRDGPLVVAYRAIVTR